MKENTKAKQKLRERFQTQIWCRENTWPAPRSRYDYGLYWLFGLELRMMKKQGGW